MRGLQACGLLISVVALTACRVSPPPQEAPKAVQPHVEVQVIRGQPLLEETSRAEFEHCDPRRPVGGAVRPGKEKALIAGFRFTQEDFGALREFHIVKSETDVRFYTHIPHGFRHILLKRGKERLELQFMVAHGSIYDAQHIMSEALSSGYSAAFSLVWREGTGVGVKVGDVAYIDAKAGHSQRLDETRRIMFARQNIVVFCRKWPDTRIDLLALAATIDRRIQAEPEFTKADVQAKRPVISRLALAKDSMKPGRSTAIHVELSQHYDKKIFYRCDSNVGGMYQMPGESDGSKLHYALEYGAHEVKNPRLRVFCVTDHLLFSDPVEIRVDVDCDKR